MRFLKLFIISILIIALLGLLFTYIKIRLDELTLKAQTPLEDTVIEDPVFEEPAPAAGDAKITSRDIIYSDNGLVKLKSYLKYGHNVGSTIVRKVFDVEIDGEVKANWLASNSSSGDLMAGGNFQYNAFNHTTVVVTSSFSDNDLRIYTTKGEWKRHSVKDSPIGEHGRDASKPVNFTQISVIPKEKDIDLQIDPAIVFMTAPGRVLESDPACRKMLRSHLGLVEEPFLECDYESVNWEPHLLSVTKIKGTVNSAAPNNIGLYKIVFYKSKDLKDWREVSTIEIPNRNLEDIKLYYSVGQEKVYALYEVEEYDKGPSEIHIAESSDFGLTWTDKTLIRDGNDNEPAAIVKCEYSRYSLLYFSSDKENPGKSYAGANGYVLKLDDNNNPVGEPKKIPVGDRVLLLDASGCGDVVGIRDYLDKENKKLFLYSFNYNAVMRFLK